MSYFIVNIKKTGKFYVLGSPTHSDAQQYYAAYAISLCRYGELP